MCKSKLCNKSLLEMVAITLIDDECKVRGGKMGILNNKFLWFIFFRKNNSLDKLIYKVVMI